MKKRCFIFIVLGFVACHIQAQPNFKFGYIIKPDGDTTYGDIDYRGDLMMGEVCRFKPKGQAEIIKYSPNDIIAFRFIDSKYYISHEVKGKKIFLEFLIKGRVNIYYVRDSNGDHYYIEKEGMRMTEIPYEEGVRYKDDVAYQYESKKHIGILNIYMKDAPGFQSRIADIKKPQHDNLIKLAEDYHNKVCEGDKCIIFEKKLPAFKVDFEITGGIIEYSNPNIEKRKYFQSGVLAYIWMPRTNENLFFRTGVLYVKIKLDGENRVFYKVPLQLEYVYPTGKIKPKAAIGININNPLFHSISFAGGVNMKLIGAIKFSLNCDFEFLPQQYVGYIPGKFLSYSILAGIYFTL
jgi:hypothetical protein